MAWRVAKRVRIQTQTLENKVTTEEKNDSQMLVHDNTAFRGNDWSEIYQVPIKNLN